MAENRVYHRYSNDRLLSSFNPYLDSLYLTSSWFLARKFLPFHDERFSGESTPEPLDLCKPGPGPLLLEDLYPKESTTTERVPLIKSGTTDTGWKALRCGGQMASATVSGSKAPGSSPPGVIVSCSWQDTSLSQYLFTQGYREVPENSMLETKGRLMAIRVYQLNRCEIYKRKRERTLRINSNPQTSSMSI